MRHVALLILLLAPGPAAPAAPPCAADHETVSRLASAYLERAPTEGPRTDLPMPEALCLQEALVAALAPRLGPPVGYKVGLTSAPVQAMFGADAPVRGVLLESMLLGDGAVVPAAYGARPVLEPDLLVRVRDAGVNEAATPLEVARHLSEIVPFIELADLVVPAGRPLDAGAITAINVGARLGVAGRPVPVSATPELVDALAGMRVVVRTGAGEIARASGTAILGHPLLAVIWLTGDLKKAGTRLEAGDLVSLGSFAKPAPPVPGQTVTVRYEGLPSGPMQVSVTFR